MKLGLDRAVGDISFTYLPTMAVYFNIISLRFPSVHCCSVRKWCHPPLHEALIYNYRVFPWLILVWSKMQRNNTLQTVDLPLVIAPTVIAARDAGVPSGSPWPDRCVSIAALEVYMYWFSALSTPWLH